MSEFNNSLLRAYVMGNTRIKMNIIPDLIFSQKYHYSIYYSQNNFKMKTSPPPREANEHAPTTTVRGRKLKREVKDSAQELTAWLQETKPGLQN